MDVFTVIGIMAVGFLSLVGFAVVVGGFIKYIKGA
jgi:hypothetical protein